MSEKLTFCEREFPIVEDGKVQLIRFKRRIDTPVEPESNLPPGFDLQVVLQLVQICNAILQVSDRDNIKADKTFLETILSWDDKSRKQYIDIMTANDHSPEIFAQISSLLQRLPIQMRASERLCRKFAVRGKNNLIHGNLFAQTNGLCGASEELLAKGLAMWRQDQRQTEYVRRVGDFLLFKGLDSDVGNLCALCIKDYFDENGNLFLR